MTGVRCRCRDRGEEIGRLSDHGIFAPDARA